MKKFAAKSAEQHKGEESGVGEIERKEFSTRSTGLDRILRFVINFHGNSPLQ